MLSLFLPTDIIYAHNNPAVCGSCFCHTSTHCMSALLFLLFLLLDIVLFDVQFSHQQICLLQLKQPVPIIAFMSPGGQMRNYTVYRRHVDPTCFSEWGSYGSNIAHAQRHRHTLFHTTPQFWLWCIIAVVNQRSSWSTEIQLLPTGENM